MEVAAAGENNYYDFSYLSGGQLSRTTYDTQVPLIGVSYDSANAARLLAVDIDTLSIRWGGRFDY